MTRGWWIYKPRQYFDCIFELIEADQAKVFEVVGNEDNSPRFCLYRWTLAEESEFSILNGKARLSTLRVKDHNLLVKASFVFTAHDGYLCFV